MAEGRMNMGAELRDKKTLLVYRAPEYSPNNVSRDAAILDAVGERLRIASCCLDTCVEGEWPADIETFDVIFHMARKLSSIMRLEQLSHPVIYNAPQGVRHVAKSRELMLMLLESAGVRVPQWWAFEPETDEMFVCEPQLQQLLPGWVKAMRPDGAQPDDVTFVRTPLEADSRILEFTAQQVPDIIVTKHLEGDLIKCYCVCDAGGEVAMIHWFYPQDTSYSKFGNAEQHNSPLSHIPFDAVLLNRLAVQIASALDLQIFGFDSIVQSADDIAVIDVNDWPTFGVCRDEAADAIVQLIE